MILYVPLNISATSKAKAIDYGIPNSTDAAGDTSTGNNRYRERDYGVGYGSSSGYASGRSYTGRSTSTFFRCG
jgi:hypothetical protein